MSEHTPPSDADLQAIEERANAATPGPWETDSGGCCVYEAAFSTRDDTVLYGPVAQVAISADGTRADATFIAHAQSDVPRLIAEIRRLRSLREP